MKETKWDVFDETLSNLKKMDAQIEEEWGYSQLTMGVGKHGDVESIREIEIAEIRDRYAAALPDDLPVVPKDVSEWLTWCKRSNHSLKDALDGETRVSEDVFARAWILGVWKVSETGEIVKLEAEK